MHNNKYVGSGVVSAGMLHWLDNNFTFSTPEGGLIPRDEPQAARLTANTSTVFTSSTSWAVPVFRGLGAFSQYRRNIVFIVCNGAQDLPSTPSGWTNLGGSGGATGTAQVSVFYRDFNGSEASDTQTFTFGTARSGMAVSVAVENYDPSFVPAHRVVTGGTVGPTFNTSTGVSATNWVNGSAAFNRARLTVGLYTFIDGTVNWSGYGNSVNENVVVQANFKQGTTASDANSVLVAQWDGTANTRSARTITMSAGWGSFYDTAVTSVGRTNPKLAFPARPINTQVFYGPTVSTASGGTTVVAPLHTNSQAFFGPRIVRTMRPALYADGDTFFTQTLRRTMRPAVHANAQAFFTQTLRVTLKPALHTETDTFYTQSIRRIMRPAAHTNTQAFFSASLRMTLKPSLHTDGDTFYTQAIRRTLRPTAFTNAQTFYTQSLRVTLKPALYSDGDTFYGPTVSVAGANKVAPLYTNTQSFFSPSIRVTLKPGLHTNTQTFQTQTLRRTLRPALHTETDTFYTQSIRRTLRPAVFANAQTFFGPRLQIRLRPSAYANGQTFYSVSLALAGKVSPPLYVNAQAFYGPSVVGATVTTPAEVMWPIASRPKWRRRDKAQDEDQVTPPISSEIPRDRKASRKWAKGTLRDALTEAGARLPDPLPEAPALQDPGRPAVTMAQMLAEQAALEEAARRQAEALRLEAIRRDDEEVIALFLSRY